jgi:hypothetical protein
MNQRPTTGSYPRYGCHECREDAELVMSGRAFDSVREQYEVHMKECRDCRRVHRVLLAVYEDPFELPSLARGVRADREFSAIIRNARTNTREPWYERLWIRGGIVTLSAAAAALAMTLMGVSPLPATPSSSSGMSAVQQPLAQTVTARDPGGIDHPAQSYARVVGGSASVNLPHDLPSSGNTLPVGTSFDLELSESLQVALAGKVVANFTPGTELEWTHASPKLLEVRLDRGLIAMRYDRRPADPILQVRTPDAVVRVVGTVFTVQVDSDQTTVVSVLRGAVEVLDPTESHMLAEVEAGYRFDLSRSAFDDVGKIEVAAALPLSNEAGSEELANGQVPASWIVPGLSTEPKYRNLRMVPSRDAAPTTVLRVPAKARNRLVAAPEDDGENFLAELTRDAERSRRAEVLSKLNRCQSLYDDPTERYRTAECLSSFLKRHGNDPLATEAYLLVGMLRMDYALDYAAADIAFAEFLRRAPRHPRAELAIYRLWLSATEDGRISTAIERARAYLSLYPNGRYVGRMLHRFPELKSEL